MWRFVPPPYREGYVAEDRFISDSGVEEEEKEDSRFGAKVKRAMTSKEEVKMYRSTVSALTIPTAGTLSVAWVLNAPNAGVGFYNITGRRIREVGLHTRGLIYCDTESSMKTLRMTVFRDNAPNGAVPTVSDIFDRTLFVSAVTSAFGFNWPNHERFTILYDKSLSLNPGVLISAGNTLSRPLLVDVRVPVHRELTFRSNGVNWTNNPVASGGAIGVLLWSNVDDEIYTYMSHDFYYVES